MKEGFVYESGGTPNERDLELINKFTRRPLEREEVYVFSVVLCDNEVDRDFEHFTTEALEKMAKMYVGKTGIFDHSFKAQDQVARIFDCEVERVENSLTKRGEPYCRLKARAYTINCESNKDFILSIDAGIRKEVSVGCACASSVCSVCGAEKAVGCEHKKGRFYRKNGKKQLCYHSLGNPVDAYEWSFVAVPAQQRAGVVKAFGKNIVECATANEFVELLKSSRFDTDVTIKASEMECLSEMFISLEKDAEAGAIYKKELLTETSRLGGILCPEVGQGFYKKALADFSLEELREARTHFEKQLDRSARVSFQLEKTEQNESKQNNNNYLI